jgi:class 3 adenylate cyclase
MTHLSEYTDEYEAPFGFPGPNADVRALVAWWRGRPSEPCPVGLLHQAADSFLRLDAPLLAYDVATEGLQQHAGDFILRRWQALALARSGSPRRAQAILRELAREQPDDEETLGLLARTYKDFALSAATPVERQDALRRAFEVYHDGYRKRRLNYWLGINSASIAVLRGDLLTAVRLAESIFLTCRDIAAQQTAASKPDYWLSSTLGEAELIRGHVEAAAQWYRQAALLAHGHRGSIATMRRNATLLLSPASCLPLTDEQRAAIQAAFPRPQVVLFAGHMIDLPDRRRSRLPGDLAPRVQRRIRGALDRFGGHLIGYSSAACGSDIMFLEAVLAAGGEAHVVLPYDREDFARDSVDFGGTHWRERFEEVLAHATEVVIASPRQKLSLGGASYGYANNVLTGLAMAHAARVDGSLHTLAVWDGKIGDGPGGTASIVARWSEAHLEPPVIIDASDLLAPDRIPTPPDTDASDTSQLPPNHGMEVRAIMFLDVVRFSQLAEEQMPVFVDHFLRTLGELASLEPPQGPLAKESRGDGVYFAFENVGAAGRFALQVNDILKNTDWGKIGLPEDFSVRISLHAGPVYGYTCPFLGRTTYTGNHVNLAARIEQSTPVGHVYASQQFAALTREAGVTDFDCDYAGPVVLAKNYGTFPLYHVGWRRQHPVL